MAEFPCDLFQLILDSLKHGSWNREGVDLVVWSTGSYVTVAGTPEEEPLHDGRTIDNGSAGVEIPEEFSGGCVYGVDVAGE